jgi:hypothetical protein
LTASWRAALLVGCALCVTSAPASAWNATGHRLVATIAWIKLDPEAREEASALLRAHADYERWEERAGKSDLDRRVFVAASTWADEIRKDPRFFDSGRESATPLLAGFPDMERHRDWHYVNWPLSAGAPQAAVGGAIDLKLPALAKLLADRRVDNATRAYALAWLIHLVGDAHQPLHASLRIDSGPDDEALIVVNPFNARRPRSTLHVFWDDLPEPALRGERLDSRARALIASTGCPSANAASDEWLAESWRLARDEAYPPGKDNPLTLDAAFYEKSRAIAERRLVAAGCRLAELLARTLGR